MTHCAERLCRAEVGALGLLVRRCFRWIVDSLTSTSPLKQAEHLLEVFGKVCTDGSPLSW